MNQLDELLRSTLDHHAQDAPPAAPVVSRVLKREQPRRYRNGWLAVAAVATATAAMVAIGVTQLDGGGPSSVPTGPPGMFTDREVTYAEDGVIHYGTQTIDVGSYEIKAFVATDDGFVFVDGGDVYFTDGTGVERIGQTAGWGDQYLAADASGSYAAWIDGSDVVVYDTASGSEALREPVPGDDMSAVAVDGSHAYVSSGRLVDDWDLDQQTKTSFTRPRSYDEIGDAANGYLLWYSGVVSRNPEATEPVFRKTSGMDESHLSPNGKYVAGVWWIYDRASQQDITPNVPGKLGPFEVVVQWLDNDRYVADSVNNLTSVDPERHDLLICSASARSCEVAVELTESVVYPNGIAHEGG